VILEYEIDQENGIDVLDIIALKSVSSRFFISVIAAFLSAIFYKNLSIKERKSMLLMLVIIFSKIH